MAVGANIGLLGYFKYANFFVEATNDLVGSSFHLETIVLPLAISFFTLQQVAYMVPDVEAAVRECEGRGMFETGRIIPSPGTEYVYMSSPAMRGLAIELMPHDQGFLDEYARCAAEAETWNGSDPYRLITF